MKRWFAIVLAIICAAALADDEPWQLVGQQGLVQVVIVSNEEVRNQGLYERVVMRLCEPERTCFINFYTNSTGAKVEMPLPDAIANEPSATFRRSAKNGVTIFMWSCRLKIPDRECF